MRSITTAVLASVAALGLLAGCGSDDKESVPDSVVAADVTVPDAATDATTVDGSTGNTLLPGLTVPQETIDLMIAQFEAAGMKVDRACFTALLSDESLRDLAEQGGQGTPSPELTQKFLACMSTGG